MNMPLRLFLILAAVLWVTACENDDSVTGPPQDPPRLVTSTDSLALRDDDPEATLQLSSDREGSITWKVTGKPPWATVTPESGAVNQSPTSVVVRGDASSLSPGAYDGAIAITSTGGDADIFVSFLVQAAGLSATPDSVIFDYFVEEGTFTVANTGNALLSWTATPGPSYLDLDVTAGALAPGEDALVTVSLDRTGMPTGSHTGSILVQSDGGQTDTVGVRVLHFVETKWLLEHQFVDAEFSRETNRIIAVSADPPMMHRLDPEGRTIQSIELPAPPNCVALRPDGAFAAAGHNGFVTYVDVSTMSVVQTYSVTTDALDILLPSNGWVYVFPVRDQWEYIRCIELATGDETMQTGWQIYAGMRGRLHPSGNSFYGAHTNLSPSDMYRFDITQGTAALVWDSPYHGDYNTGGPIWISDDGARIFSFGGDVFRSSSIQSQDMTYNGHLNDSQNPSWIEHSSAAGRIFTVAATAWSGEPAPEVRVYRADFLAFVGVIPLPQFFVPNGSTGGTLHRSRGQFVFVNEAGTRMYTLVRAAPASGLLHDWALWSRDVAPLP